MDSNHVLRILFFTAVWSSSMCSVGGIGQNVLCMVTDSEIAWAMLFISLIGYCSLLQCVLAIFLWRLNETFQDSPFALSAMKRGILGYSFVTMQISLVTLFTLTSWIVFDPNRYDIVYIEISLRRPSPLLSTYIQCIRQKQMYILIPLTMTMQTSYTETAF